MIQAWYLCPWVVRLVIATFLASTLAQDLAWAQPRGDGRAVCDLTGQWRSSFGVMELHQRSRSPAAAVVTPGAEAPATPDHDAVLMGSYRGQSGEGRLDGVVIGDRAELRWYRPDSFSPPADAGDGYLDISADCDALDGFFRYGFEGEYTESWRARRVRMSVAVEAPPALVEARAAVRRQLAAVEELRGRLRRDGFSVGARAAGIGGDAGALFSFVRDDIAYEAYAGALRGAHGTLMAGAGNAVDQSLLLAALLREHGFAVRFAAAELDRAGAARLLAAMPQVMPEAAPERPAEADILDAFPIAAEAIAIGDDRARMERHALLEAVAADSADQQRWIAEALAAAGVVLAADDAAHAQALLDAARQHVWVQMRDGEGWVDLDPSWPGAEPGFTTADPAIHESLPDELYHRLRIRVTIERHEDGALITAQVAGWQMRIADVMDGGLPAFWIVNAPMDAAAPSNASGDVLGMMEAANVMQAERLGTARVFRPMLRSSDGAVLHGAAFDLTGRILPDDAQVRLAQNAAATISESFGGIGDILGGLLDEPDDEAPPASGPVLTAEWIDYEISGPGTATRSHRRAVFDRIGEAVRAGGGELTIRGDDAEMRAGLASLYELLVTGADIDGDFAIDTMLDTFLANRAMLEALVDSQHGLPALDNSVLASTASYPNRLLIYLLLQQEMARQSARLAGVRAYQAGATVVVGEQRFARAADGGETFRRGLDVVEAAMRTGPRAAGGTEFQLRYGTAIAALEREMLDRTMRVECPECPLSGAFSAASIFRAARAQQVPLLVVAPATAEADLARASLTPDVRARIAATVAAGALVVVPERAVSLGERETVAWWRIDPATMATVGVLESGTGGAAEYLNTLVNFALFSWPFWAGTAGGYASCVGLAGGTGGGKGFACALCGLIGGICLQLSYLALPGLGAVAASSTCGFGTTVGGLAVCTAASLMP